MKDMSDLKAFLIEAEVLIDQGHFQQALDYAGKRSMLFPGDIGAPLVTIKALRGLGRRSEAIQIIQDLRETLDCLISMIQDIDFEEGYDVVNVPTVQHNSADSSITQAACLDDEENTVVSQDAYGAKDETDTIDDEDPSVVLEAFYTPTMAELFVHQGHIDMAYEIYSGLLKKYPTNPVYKERLQDLSLLLQNSQTKEQPEKQRQVIDELERWITKIKKAS